jgi:RNA polymerase sigma factor (sigma-70 family)
MKGFARSVPELQQPRSRGAELAQEVGQRDESLLHFGERDQLHALLERLDEEERQVVAAHYGLGGTATAPQQAATLEHLSQALGMTRHRVRQIEQAALSKLRRLAAGCEQ